ncbi:MAG: hypothetical protein PVF75_06995 [Granulosicoccaceae bacterium]|jgi:hypothetical protein
MDNRSIYRDYAAMCLEFREGMRCLEQGDEQGALDCFARADAHTAHDNVYKNKYRSYHGLLLLRSGHVNGLDLCRQAASSECFDGDVFFNLARAELARGNRRTAISTIRHGLGVDATHPDLIHMRHKLGIRRAVALPFLSRDNPINKFLGKITYHGFQHSQA